jgi:hypothetical protein
MEDLSEELESPDRIDTAEPVRLLPLPLTNETSPAEEVELSPLKMRTAPLD